MPNSIEKFPCLMFSHLVNTLILLQSSQQKTPKPSSKLPTSSRPQAPSSFSQPSSSSFGSSVGMTSTASYGKVGWDSGNTGIGPGLSGSTGPSRMNSGLTGLSMSGMNSSGLSAASSLNSGSFGMSSANSTPRFAATGSSVGNQTNATGGSTALDSLFAPELEHLQNKSKPSMNAMQAQQAPVHPSKFLVGWGEYK